MESRYWATHPHPSGAYESDICDGVFAHRATCQRRARQHRAALEYADWHASHRREAQRLGVERRVFKHGASCQFRTGQHHSPLERRGRADGCPHWAHRFRDICRLQRDRRHVSEWESGQDPPHLGRCHGWSRPANPPGPHGSHQFGGCLCEWHDCKRECRRDSAPMEPANRKSDYNFR